jgi:hypothetical protein
MNTMPTLSSDEKLNLIALRRLFLLICPQNREDQVQQTSFYFEAGQLGFRVENLSAFTSFSPTELSSVFTVLKEMRGGNVKYVPLFKNFPNEIPNDEEYLWQRIANFFSLSFAEPFDKTKFGACPVTQRQKLSYWIDSVKAQEQKANDSKIVWVTLTCLPLSQRNEKLVAWMESLLYAPTAINDLMWDDLLYACSLLRPRIDFGRVKVKETLARLACDVWLKENQIIVSTPTDFLRVLAYQQSQDVSLVQSVKLKGLKLRKPQRKEIVRFLSTCSNLEEDLLRYKGLWISLSEWIHPGDYFKKYPTVAKAFDALRNNKIKTFLGQANIAENTLKFLSVRPGVLFRQLSYLLTAYSDEEVAQEIGKLKKDSVPLPLLLTTHAILQYSGPRMAIVKSGKAHTIADKETIKIPEKTLQAIKDLILANLKTEIPWKTVWIDPAVRNLVLPLQTRKQSEGLLNLARGSRIPVTSPIVRLFVYWKQKETRTDLDLAVLKLGKNGDVQGRVSWNYYSNLDDDFRFSGDLTSAPYGAAEFMDCRVEKITSPYIFASIKKFSGEKFPDLESCYAGWMEREKADTNFQQFDPKTVVQKVNVIRDGNTWVPFVFDVERNEIVYTDLYLTGGRCIENDKHFGDLALAAIRLSENKPNYGQLLKFFLEANGIQEVEETVAEYKIGMNDNVDLNVLSLYGDDVLKLGQK